MAIYKNGKTLKACKGDYGPVNLYLGETKIAGWRTARQQGKDLAFAGTYKDRIGGLTVYGKNADATVAFMGKNLCEWDGQPVKYMGHQSIMTLWTVAVQPRAMSFSAWIDNSGCSMPRRIRVNGYDKNLSQVYSSVNGNDILPGEQGISRVENVTNHLRNENIKYLVILTGGDYDTEKNQEYSYIRNPQAEARPECTSYQPYMRTQASFGGTLRALPVSGDSYTYVDVEGTKWIADTVELSGGRVIHVQRIMDAQILQTPVRTDITDTEAGQAFLSLASVEGMTRITADAEVSVILKIWEE